MEDYYPCFEFCEEYFLDCLRSKTWLQCKLPLQTDQQLKQTGRDKGCRSGCAYMERFTAAECRAMDTTSNPLGCPVCKSGGSMDVCSTMCSTSFDHCLAVPDLSWSSCAALFTDDVCPRSVPKYLCDLMFQCGGCAPGCKLTKGQALVGNMWGSSAVRPASAPSTTSTTSTVGPISTATVQGQAAGGNGYGQQDGDGDGVDQVVILAVVLVGFVLVIVSLLAWLIKMRSRNKRVQPHPGNDEMAVCGKTPTGSEGSFRTALSETQSRPMPEGKDFHFFVSHKKTHSKLGAQPAQLAGHLKDLLEAKGFVGFFDVDGLKEISERELERGVLRSCAVIILLNDETCSSKWCKFEWDVAHKAGIQVKCVVDAQNTTADAVLAQVLGSEESVLSRTRDWLLRYQWAEHIAKYRKQLVEDLVEWLDSVIYNPDPKKGRGPSCHGVENKAEDLEK